MLPRRSSVHPHSPHGDVITPASTLLATWQRRGFVEQSSDLAAVDASLSSGTTTIYAGFDPKGSALHVGHLVPLMALRWAQRLGHRPIVLIGSVTAAIGDPAASTEREGNVPSSRSSSRYEASLRAQVDRLLVTAGDLAVRFVDNADWLRGWDHLDFIQTIGRHFTVNRMIATKTYRERLHSERPLTFLEFNYQLLQAYDYYHLHRFYGCNLQIGGSDQWGNMIAGVELIRRLRVADGAAMPRPDEPSDAAHCLTLPLLTAADGRKMGKWGPGTIWLDPELTSPFDFFQYWVNRDDRDVPRLLHLLTEMPDESIESACAPGGAALRAAKLELAYQVTTAVHGQQAADQAREASAQAFGLGEDWSAVPCVAIRLDPTTSTLRIIDLLVHPLLHVFRSKREARQRVEANAIRIDGVPVVDPNFELTAGGGSALGYRLHVGKRHRFRVKLVH